LGREGWIKCPAILSNSGKGVNVCHQTPDHAPVATTIDGQFHLSPHTNKAVAGPAQQLSGLRPKLELLATFEETSAPTWQLSCLQELLYYILK
jgi:hypothetical protein